MCAWYNQGVIDKQLRRHHVKKYCYLGAAEALACLETFSALTHCCFLHWRFCIMDARRNRYESEIEMLVGLLQQSTLTCRELRTQLMEAQGRSDVLDVILVFACMKAWSKFAHSID
eukprot:TRINITY_DN18696_c0_g1_i2.p1 TRINITY_DN18696_c0_g1~~TRINITY_DN18696_c0_g1_i2.p1  ORF type:complete len:116 (+),score=15.49 TRINITY_DN18696_c0_g1_i2:563-910(+)